jgi:hypothetical protein
MAKVPEGVRLEVALSSGPAVMLVKMIALFDFVYSIDFPMFAKCAELAAFLRRCIAEGI